MLWSNEVVTDSERPPQASVRETVHEFMAHRVEKGRPLYATSFPPGVRLHVIEQPHPGENREPSDRYVTFQPDRNNTQYMAPETDFRKCTRPVERK
jgi:hypothetical protein